MDLTLEVEDYVLNIRAAGVFMHNDKVLIHNNVNSDHCCLPGGRIEIGENSQEAIKREIKEEMGKDIEIIDYIATIENFFEMKNKKYHEIFFLYKVEFANKEDQKINHIIYNAEGKQYLQYEWIDLKDIEKYNLLPKCLKEILKNKQYPVHIINNDLD